MNSESAVSAVTMLAAALVAGTQAACAATQPQPGIYNQYQYVLTSSSKPAGLSGCNAVGATLGGYLSYPGPSKAGAYTSGATEVGTNMRMQVCKLPIAPATGATTWSGTENCVNTYITGAPVSYTETFSYRIVYDTTSEWLIAKTLTYPVSGGSCTETRNVGLERTGK